MSDTQLYIVRRTIVKDNGEYLPSNTILYKKNKKIFIYIDNDEVKTNDIHKNILELNDETFKKYFKDYPFNNLSELIDNYSPIYIKLSKDIISCTNKITKKYIKDDNEKKYIKKKIDQIEPSSGCTKTYTIIQAKEILECKNVSELNIPQSKGSQIFNRTKRYNKPIHDTSRKNFERSESYPYPDGLRCKDYSSPKQLCLVSLKLRLNYFKIYNNKVICEELINRLQNIINKYSEELDPEYLKIINDIIKKKQVCHYCNNRLIKDDLLSNGYGSQTNNSELCHRDPNKHTTYDNIYWGHGECNRRQSNNTEYEIVLKGLELLYNNPIYITKDVIILIQKINIKYMMLKFVIFIAIILLKKRYMN